MCDRRSSDDFNNVGNAKALCDAKSRCTASANYRATRVKTIKPKREGMAEDREFYLPLKDGGQANVREGLAERFQLERILRSHPQHFNLLVRLAKGEQIEPKERQSIAFGERAFTFCKQAARCLKTAPFGRLLVTCFLLALR